MNKYLLMAGVLLVSTQAYGATDDLINAVKKGDLNAVQALVNNGEDVNGINEQGNSALHYAIAMDNADMTKLLLQNGANMNLSNDKGWTPLKIAEKKNVKNVTAVLVEELQREQSEAHQIAIEQDRMRTQAVREAQNKIQQQKQETVVKQEDVPTIETSDDIDVILVQKLQNAITATEKARSEAVAAQERAEKAAKILEDKIAQLEGAETANKIPLKSNIQKTETKMETTKVAKPAPKKVIKPVPAPSSKPKPKPVILVKSKVIEGLYAGDEEITYCMNVLGQGENRYMLNAASYYAASVGIKEMRYNQLMDMAEQFYANADENNLRQRISYCSQVVTPQDKEKQNQIVRSINHTIGADIRPY